MSWLKRLGLWGALCLCCGCGGDDEGDDGATGVSTTISSTAGSSAGSGSAGSSGAGSSTTAMTTAGSGTATTEGGSSSDSGGSMLDPPEGESSGGSGGGSANGEVRTTAGGVTYRVIAPSGAGPQPLMIVYSGTEGGAGMTQNLLSLRGQVGLGDHVFAVLDGVDYFGNGSAGVDVLDTIRADYDIDNDRTFLFSESAGTSAGLELGLKLRQSYFAAYWANDVNNADTPSSTAAELGFAPFGNAGPGGDFPDANAIVAGMEAAGYRVLQPAPYDGPGSGTHGSPDQFIAALQWFPGKTRQ